MNEIKALETDTSLPKEWMDNATKVTGEFFEGKNSALEEIVRVYQKIIRVNDNLIDLGQRSGIDIEKRDYKNYWEESMRLLMRNKNKMRRNITHSFRSIYRVIAPFDNIRQVKSINAIYVVMPEPDCTSIDALRSNSTLGALQIPILYIKRIQTQTGFDYAQIKDMGGEWTPKEFEKSMKQVIKAKF